MSITIPIITEFDGAGVSKAIAQFKQLETNGQKAQFAIKKAAVPAAAALAGVTAALGDAVQAAVADVAAQEKLAGQIARTTGATDAQIKANEDWISVQGKLLGYTDDQLRPAISRLATQTHDLAEAQKGAALAMDIATATGKPLETVVSALEKAYGGNEKALAKLSPELKDMIKSGMSLDEVMGVLSTTFGGAASDAANTAEGKFKRLGIALGETKESIGTALLPVVEAVLPYLQKMSDWASENPEVFTIIAVAIGAIALSILAVNAAMALNPFTLIAAGIAILVAGIAIAYNKFEGFRNLVKTVVNGLSDYFEFMANNWIKATNVIISGINLISPFKDIPHMGTISMGHIGDDPTSGFTSARQAEAAMFGGSVSSAGAPTPIMNVPSLPSTSKGGKSLTAPPTALGGGDGGRDFGFGDIGPFFGAGQAGININVDAGLIASPATVGQDIIDAILAAQRNSGVVFQPASGL